MKHTITMIHEVEASSWDEAVAVLLREDSPVKYIRHCYVAAEGGVDMLVGQQSLVDAADKVRGDTEEVLHNHLPMIIGGQQIGQIHLDGYRLISIRNLRLLKAGLPTNDSVRATLTACRIALQKAAGRGVQNAKKACKMVDKALGEIHE